MSWAAQADAILRTLNRAMTGTPDETLRDLGRSSIGLNLARVRQEKGLTLEEIARSTSISLRFLQAIENEDFAELPGGVYSTSYIRQYATAIACDPSIVLERYREQTKPKAKAGSGPSNRGVSWQYRRLHQALQSCLDHLTPYRRGYPNT